MVQATLAHVSSGCNANTNSLSTMFRCVPFDHEHGNYCGAFASKNAVCMLSSSVNSKSDAARLKVVETLKHREAVINTTKITSVKIMSDDFSCGVRVLAGDSEGRVFVWTKSNGQWNVQKLQDIETSTKMAVAAVGAAATRTCWMYVAAFTDGTLVLYEQKQGENANLLHLLELGKRSIMEAVDMTVIINENNKEQSFLVAAGGVDQKIHLLEVTKKVTNLLKLDGHRDWIRSLAFERKITSAGDELMLASASQDHKIRLWRIMTSLGDAKMACSKKTQHFQAQGCFLTYTVSFDALLLGHEDWVTSVQWMENSSALLSSSMDNSLIIWTRNANDGSIWSPSLRVGELGGIGLLSAGFLPAYDERINLIALGFKGQLEYWEQQPAPSTSFLPAISVNGHGAEVTDISWSPRGKSFVSVSLDQTARILARISPVDNALMHSAEWFEVSRAQVHGYDINCACFVLGDRLGNNKFVSGAAEKILRVFETPDEVEKLVNMTHSDERALVDSLNQTDLQVRKVNNAYLSELSLTNKSPKIEACTSDKMKGDGYAKFNEWVSLPVGDTLGRRTLWPEIRKLYGHGNELLTVASSYAGDLIASACKSREERYAAVRLWNTLDWTEAQEPLGGPKSSVVQLAFSQNDKFLLSVSKDRHFCLYEREEGPERKFKLLERVKAHKRIIWSCSWAPNSALFALGSRDQSFSLWWKTQDTWSQACEPVTFEAAVTAVAFAHYSLAESVDLLAVGFETGAIQFFTVSKSKDEPVVVVCTLVGKVAWESSPSAAILRLAWRPSNGDKDYVLAVASSDNSVRVYNVMGD
ncbi:putative elongator complex protein [Plasmopara halstedii]